MKIEDKLIVRRLVAAIGLFVLAAYYLYAFIAITPNMMKIISLDSKLNDFSDPGKLFGIYFVEILILVVSLGIGITYLVYRNKHLTRGIEWTVVIISILTMFICSIFITGTNNVDGYILTGLVVLGLSFDQSKKEKKVETKQTSEPKDNNLSQLVELKKLLDSGVITKEEFKAKKKQILGL
ncbi:hypothetical protein ATX69_02410 [Oenococcus oeni]|uniref:SHOCT domain-containing protein n=2 Tax=Oenococcus oeni TaxID=1247 RepID=UPI0008F8DC76|nr:SHOCT domain-containing protein [Oenococcus oeni]OIM34175.1 hypothetical protein ATX69_02410 [Oenococcus oeni]